MDAASQHDVTELLRSWARGDREALDRLVPLVHDQLHRLAHQSMRGERPGHTLQTTALVNEAYLRLVDAGSVHWQDRTHFFAIAATVMRRILVDFARARRAAKRQAILLAAPIDVDRVLVPAAQPDADVVALDDALQSLAGFDPRGARVVELRYFGGLTVDESAEVLGVSPKTVKRDWTAARAWLLGELQRGGAG
jgi:RNA polymerase sigma factor (TIGR02999 family)